MTALKNLGKLEDTGTLPPVLVCIMDREPEALGGYQKMVTELRDAGIRAELFQGNPKQFGKQLQYADRRNSPCAIIQGSDEAEAAMVQIKDLVEGKKKAAAIADNQEWREERPGQYEVAEADLVAEVAKLLERQKAG